MIDMNCTCPHWHNIDGVDYMMLRDRNCPVHGDEARAEEIAEAFKPVADAAIAACEKLNRGAK